MIMPLVRHDGKTYYLRWTEEWDRIILTIAKMYKRNGRIEWKQAEEDGMFAGLPKTSNIRAIRHRAQWLLYGKGRWKRESTSTKPYVDTRTPLFKEFAAKTNPKKSVWNDKQNKIFEKLVKKYTRENGRIDWQSLWDNPLRKELPKSVSLDGLRKVKYEKDVQADPVRRKAKVKFAMRTYKKHKKRYSAVRLKRVAEVRQKVAEFLQTKILLRK